MVSHGTMIQGFSRNAGAFYCKKGEKKRGKEFTLPRTNMKPKTGPFKTTVRVKETLNPKP